MTTDLTITLFWDDSPDLWDTVVLGDEALPGLARVTGAHGRKLDVKSAPGTNGARIVDKGYQPAKVEITLKLWTKEQLDAWFRIAPTLTYRSEPPRRATSTTQTKQQIEAARRVDLVRASVESITIAQLAESNATEQEIASKLAAQNRPATARARALERRDFSVSHPALDTIQVHRLYIEEVSTPNPTGSPGVYEVRIKAIESRAPRAQATRAVTPATSFATGIRTAFDARGPSGTGGAGP